MCCIITKIDHLLHNVHVMFRGVSRISGRGCLRSGPIRKVGVGVHFRSDIRKLGGQSTSGPIYENWGGAVRFRSDIRKRGGGGGAVHFRSDIRKVGGGGGQFASGPIQKSELKSHVWT